MVGNFELTEIDANSLPLENRKKLAITSLFTGISKEHLSALSIFIDEELKKFNTCDMSMQNNRFKEAIRNIGLPSPGKKAAIITPFMLKFTLDYNTPMKIISNNLAEKSN